MNYRTWWAIGHETACVLNTFGGIGLAIIEPSSWDWDNGNCILEQLWAIREDVA